MKKIYYFFISFALIFVSCGKEELVEVENSQVIFHKGYLSIQPIIKTVTDTIGQTDNKVISYSVKIQKIKVSRDAIVWYTIFHSSTGEWLDLIKGTGSLNLKDTLLPVGVYQYAYIDMDSAKYEREKSCATILLKDSVSAVFTTEATYKLFGQEFLAYPDTVRSKTDTTYTIIKTKASKFIPPKVKYAGVKDSLYWVIGGTGLQIKKDVKTNFVIGIHPEIVNRETQSNDCGSNSLTRPVLFIGTKEEYDARDTVKAK